MPISDPCSTERKLPTPPAMKGLPEIGDGVNVQTSQTSLAQPEGPALTELLKLIQGNDRAISTIYNYGRMVCKLDGMEDRNLVVCNGLGASMDILEISAKIHHLSELTSKPCVAPAPKQYSTTEEEPQPKPNPSSRSELKTPSNDHKPKFELEESSKPGSSSKPAYILIEPPQTECDNILHSDDSSMSQDSEPDIKPEKPSMTDSSSKPVLNPKGQTQPEGSYKPKADPPGKEKNSKPQNVAEISSKPTSSSRHMTSGSSSRKY